MILPTTSNVLILGCLCMSAQYEMTRKRHDQFPLTGSVVGHMCTYVLFYKIKLLLSAEKVTLSMSKNILEELKLKPSQPNYTAYRN